MLLKSKPSRTRITDLPANAVPLSQDDLRIVAGGLKAAFMCNSRVATPGFATSRTAFKGTVAAVPTDYNTNGDHDAD
jgi:hypothetical protein